LTDGNGDRSGFLPLKVTEILLAIILSLFGFVLSNLRDEIGELRHQLSEYRTQAVESYVRRDDYRVDLNRIEKSLVQISAKLDELKERASSGSR
jgi:hypothetical protein